MEGDTMTVIEAAKLLNMNPQTLRLALQQGKFPFGVAVRTSPNRFTYKIFPKRLESYLKGVEYEEESIICGCNIIDLNTNLNDCFGER